MILARLVRRASAFLLVPSLASFAACSVATEPSGSSAQAVSSDPNVIPRFAMPMRNPDGTLRAHHAPMPAAPIVNANRLLTYGGGPVISKVKVYAVFWGPNVDTTVTSQIGGFYTAVTNSAYFDWLSEYNTVGTIDGNVGTGQMIGRGTYGGAYTITPSTSATTISEITIGNELQSQLAAGKLPAPEFDAQGLPISLYMFDFPPGVTITLQGSQSCVQFCAFHYSQTINGKDIPYGVHPDMGPTSGCANGCGPSSVPFENVTDVHSHEMIEAVTDTSAVQTSWYNNAQGEIGDICATGAGETGTVAGYTVQKEWSNNAGACVVTNSTPVCDGSSQPPACRNCVAADCGGTKPVCETTATDVKFGQCVQCTDNTKCAGGSPICDKGTTAANDTCRGCASDVDCPGMHCATGASDPNKGKCVQCTADPECTAPAVCNTATDTCVGCLSDAQCSNPKPVCGTGSTCRACAGSADCASNPKGHACAASGACVPCAKDAD